MNDSLNSLQAIISNALTEMNEKSLITEANLARKVRMLAKIETKNKAGVCLNDLEKAVDSLESQGNIKYSIHLNSANEYMIKKSVDCFYILIFLLPLHWNGQNEGLSLVYSFLLGYKQ